jgi:hypothetical protein
MLKVEEGRMKEEGFWQKEPPPYLELQGPRFRFDPKITCDYCFIKKGKLGVQAESTLWYNIDIAQNWH